MAKDDKFRVIDGPLKGANAIPYDIICHMLDDGMLSEATFSGSDNAEENKKLAQDNLPFIVDYYYHNNRTK